MSRAPAPSPAPQPFRQPAAPPIGRALRVTVSGVALDPSHSPRAPGEHEALIRLRRAAVSAADLAAARGLFERIGVLGHQFVGSVEAVGSASESRLLNQRVVASIVGACARCDLCQRGLGVHCRNRTILGMQGSEGCFADRFVIGVKQLVQVPDSVDDDQAAFAVDVAAGLQASGQITIEGKPYVTVLGDGPLGLLTAQVLAKRNASVRVIGKHAAHLALCEKWGVRARAAQDIGLRADQDVVVDCTGSSEGLAFAARLVRPRGKIVLKSLIPPAAGTPVPRGVDLNILALNEIELIGSFAGPVSEAVAAIARGEVEVLSLISKRMSLADGPVILKAAGQSGVLKVLVSP